MFNSFALWDSIAGGSIQVPPCGPVVSGAALYFTNSNGSQLSVTKELDLTGIRYVFTSFMQHHSFL